MRASSGGGFRVNPGALGGSRRIVTRAHELALLRRGAELARDHWQLTCLVSCGVLVRALMMVAYPPALFFPDSWGYITTAYSHSLVGLSLRWPDGYSLLIRLLTVPGRSLVQLIALQHLIGVACGVAIYVVLLRAGLSRWAAALAAALVLLDGYAITLEQYVMSDAFAGATLLAAVVVLGWHRSTPNTGEPSAASASLLRTRTVAVSGLLVTAAVLEREAAIFVIPVLVVYLLWIGAGWRLLAVFLACLVIPLSAYAGLVDHKYHVFGVTAASGWTLYGRVASFADCNDFKVAPAARPLCQRAAQRRGQPSAPDWYIWGPSPAMRLFKPDQESIDQSASTNSILEKFDRQVILHQPLAMVSATLGDFLRYLTPDVTPYNDSVSATSLPTTVHAEAIEQQPLGTYLPGTHPQVRSPAGLLRSYRSAIHVPRPVLALLALAALVALIARVPARREIFLFAGTGVILLLGTAATGGFALRYLMPAVAPLAIGGSLALSQLSSRLRGREAARGAPFIPRRPTDPPA